MIYNKDCLDHFPFIEDNSVDLILTDPPYEIGKYSTGNINLPKRKALNNNIAKWDQSFNPSLYVDEMVRVLKKDGNMFIFSCFSSFTNEIRSNENSNRLGQLKVG